MHHDNIIEIVDIIFHFDRVKWFPLQHLALIFTIVEGPSRPGVLQLLESVLCPTSCQNPVSQEVKKEIKARQHS